MKKRKNANLHLWSS